MKADRQKMNSAITAFALLTTFGVPVAAAGDAPKPTMSGAVHRTWRGTAHNWSGLRRQVPRKGAVNANHNVRNSHAGVGTSTGPARNMGHAGASGKSGYGAYGYGNNKRGPNGQAVGYGTNNNNPVGPNGKSVGSGYNNPMGVNGKPVMGSAHASGGGGPADQYGGQGVNMNNGGMAGASSQPTDAPKSPTGGSNVGGDATGSKMGEGLNSVYSEWGHPKSGKDSQGNTWKNGKLWNGYDSNHNQYHNGKPTLRQFNNKLPADMGGSSGPGEQHVTAGNPSGLRTGVNGQDGGGGQTDQGNSGGAPGRSGSGSYINGGAINGGDAPLHKPVDSTPLNTGRLNNGVTDPKRSGAIGH